MTWSHSLAHSSVGQESRHSCWVFCSASYKAKIKVLARLHPFWRLREIICLQVPSGCGGHSELLDAIHTPCHMAPNIFKASHWESPLMESFSLNPFLSWIQLLLESTEDKLLFLNCAMQHNLIIGVTSHHSDIPRDQTGSVNQGAVVLDGHLRILPVTPNLACICHLCNSGLNL